MAFNDPYSSDRARRILQEADEDENKKKIQGEILNSIFGDILHALPHHVDSNISSLFNAVAGIAPAKKNEHVIKLRTFGQYVPERGIEIKLNASYLELHEDDIFQLSNYIKIHEYARKKNIALRLVGIVAGEAASSPTSGLFFNIAKDYADGAIERNAHYPNLPDEPETFDRNTPKNF
jgi:hypothetical protein